MPRASWAQGLEAAPLQALGQGLAAAVKRMHARGQRRSRSAQYRALIAEPPKESTQEAKGAARDIGPWAQGLEAAEPSKGLKRMHAQGQGRIAQHRRHKKNARASTKGNQGNPLAKGAGHRRI